jgi:hypothetical protein
MGKSDQYIKTKFPLTEDGNENAERLCGFLSTARESKGLLL